MTITKKDIHDEIFKDTSLSKKESYIFLEKFISIIKNKSKDHNVKISGFGTFYQKTTPQRQGRNPKTKESYIIHPRNKLLFKPSNKVRGVLN